MREKLPALFVVLLLAALTAGCTSLPEELPQGKRGQALAPQSEGVLASVEKRLVERAGHGRSGFHLLNTNQEGLRWRLALVDSAQHSLDLQYYVWWGDESGDLLMKRVIDAADRGVKVRLILDDLSTMLEDETHPKLRDFEASSINSHPNISVRLFNPWLTRPLGGRAVEILTRLERLNHRMHNKMLIADNRAAILGGRNIGNEYFGLSPEFNFRDLDVVGIGPVARQASAAFDRFWNSEWVVPVASLEEAVDRDDLSQTYQDMRRRLIAAPSIALFRIEPQNWATPLADTADAMHIGSSRVYTDWPDRDGVHHEVPAHIRELLNSAASEILIANAYIIPDETAVQRIRERTANGIRVRVLTNSLASHDVPAVNSHYKLWRGPLLDAGVELYELRADAASRRILADTPPTESEFVGLHMKAMVIDRQRVFVGSLNLDPRSLELNSEMGVTVESPGLAEELAHLIERDMGPDNAWQVELDEYGGMTWSSNDVVLSEQPARDFWQRVEDVIFMAFPRELY